MARPSRRIVTPFLRTRGAEGSDLGGCFIKRLLEHWQTTQPIFRVVGGDDCAPSGLSRPQPTRVYFLIGFGAAYAVALAESVDAHRPLPCAALAFALEDFSILNHLLRLNIGERSPQEPVQIRGPTG